MSPHDLERERAAFALLRRFRGTVAVLIGGYAVSAYGAPRFSLDLDFVVPPSAVPVALKLEAGRRVDLRDLAVLAGTELDVGRVATLLREDRRDVLLEHLDALAAALVRRDFQDSLNGVYMLDERAFGRVVNRTEGLVRDLRAAVLRPAGKSGGSVREPGRPTRTTATRQERS